MINPRPAVDPQGRAVSWIEEYGEAVEPYPDAEQLTDVQLFAIALGERV